MKRNSNCFGKSVDVALTNWTESEVGHVAGYQGTLSEPGLTYYACGMRERRPCNISRPGGQAINRCVLSIQQELLATRSSCWLAFTP